MGARTNISDYDKYVAKCKKKKEKPMDIIDFIISEES